MLGRSSEAESPARSSGTYRSPSRLAGAGCGRAAAPQQGRQELASQPSDKLGAAIEQIGVFDLKKPRGRDTGSWR